MYLFAFHFVFSWWSEFYRVVGFEVEPKSIDSKRIVLREDGRCDIQDGQEMQKINPKGSNFLWQTNFEIKLESKSILDENTVTMTYEVEWKSSETRWASRYVFQSWSFSMNRKRWNIC